MCEWLIVVVGIFSVVESGFIPLLVALVLARYIAESIQFRDGEILFPSSHLRPDRTAAAP